VRVCCIIAAATIALSAFACGAGDDEPVSEPKSIEPASASADAIQVVAADYAFALSAESVSAGTVDFVVRNEAARDHEFVIVPLEGDRFALPLGEIEAFGAGETRAMRAHLSPGRYEFVCLIVSISDGVPASHMALGMRTPFEVAD
jgi:cupredoxin-like protein